MSDVEQNVIERKAPGRGHNRRYDFQQMRDAFQWQILGDKDLWASDVKVAFALSLRLNRNDYEELGKLHAWPSIDRLAEKTGLQKRNVQRSIKRLVLLGHLQVIPGGSRPGDPNHYIPMIKDRYPWPQ